LRPQAIKHRKSALRLQFNTRGVQMNTKLIMALLAASLFGLAGCAGMDRQTASTVGGAAVGGLVGDAVGGTGGAIVGGAAGAYIGNQAGKR
jgi:osmotically inducible lipoprotein OsmB